MFQNKKLRAFWAFPLALGIVVSGLEVVRISMWWELPVGKVLDSSIARAETKKETQKNSKKEEAPRSISKKEESSNIANGAKAPNPPSPKTNGQTPPGSRDIGEYMSPHLSPSNKLNSNSEYDDTSTAHPTQEIRKKDNYTNEYFETLRKQKQKIIKELKDEQTKKGVEDGEK